MTNTILSKIRTAAHNGKQKVLENLSKSNKTKLILGVISFSSCLALTIKAGKEWGHDLKEIGVDPTFANRTKYSRKLYPALLNKDSEYHELSKKYLVRGIPMTLLITSLNIFGQWCFNTSTRD